MAAATPSEFLEHDAVRFSADGVAEMDGKLAVIFVPRARVRQLELIYGSGAQQPLVVLVLGIVLAVLAIVPLIVQARAFVAGVAFPMKMMAMVGFIFPALWLIDLAVRKRWVLIVHRDDGAKTKLVFHKSRDREAIETFIMQARMRFHYT